MIFCPHPPFPFSILTDREGVFFYSFPLSVRQHGEGPGVRLIKIDIHEINDKMLPRNSGNKLAGFLEKQAEVNDETLPVHTGNGYENPRILVDLHAG